MKRTLLLALPLIVLAAGCKPNRESQVVGTWSAGGQSVELKQDKTWTMAAMGQTAEGKWSFADPTVTITTEKVAGKSIAEFKKQIETMKPLLLAQAGNDAKKKAQIEKALSTAGDPQKLTLSEDGKSLTLPNPMTGDTVTMTKSEAK